MKHITPASWALRRIPNSSDLKSIPDSPLYQQLHKCSFLDANRRANIANSHNTLPPSAPVAQKSPKPR